MCVLRAKSSKCIAGDAARAGMIGLLSARGMTWLTLDPKGGGECAVYFQSNNSPRNVLVVMLKMWNVMTIPLHKYAARARAELFSTTPALE